MRNRESIIGNVDWLTVLLYFALVFIGWLSIYTSSGGEEAGNIFDLSERYGKQLLWIGLSIILIVIVLLIDAKFFSTFAFLFYAAMILILIAVLFFGKTVAGSKSWFEIGSFAIQPAEFAKFTTALALAKFLSMLNVDMRNIRTPVISIILMILPALLILFQNDTGSALVYAAFAIVLFREGFSGIIIIFGLAMALLFILTLLFGEIYIISTLVVLLAIVLTFFKKSRRQYKSYVAVFLMSSVFVFSVNYAFQHVLESHQKKRINVLLGIEQDLRGAGYNVNQSKIAIGSGGFSGKGFRQGMLTRNQFVPEQSTDFIFCTVGEEWGFIGTLTVILLFLALLVRIIFMAERQRSRFSRIYGYGVASVLFFHFAVNIGMTIGLAPVVGIPLPFFSYGGSSLWAFTMLLFIFVKQDADRLKEL
ncbi:MAG: rod shape-determining protein RodA [Marinilabiliales bacterium]|nr:MAG: rod shape-determining protein RodA [Marinilabiliales bacterium]